MNKNLTQYFNFFLGCTILGVVIVVSLLANILAPFSPEQMFAGPRLTPPTWAYPFGTDALGRDVLSRIIYGAPLTLYVGLIFL